jgi:hypothetical protein
MSKAVCHSLLSLAIRYKFRDPVRFRNSEPERIERRRGGERALRQVPSEPGFFGSMLTMQCSLHASRVRANQGHYHCRQGNGDDVTLDLQKTHVRWESSREIRAD